uniref:Uncharacterized protein n=1 Tax=Arundo donax TaxID=35708 RepID=A0A0A8Z8J3_ARUDO
MAPGQVRGRGELCRRRGGGEGEFSEDPGSLRRSVGPQQEDPL